MTIGSVIRQRICDSLAPSTRADSKGSSDRPARPARTMSVIIGVHCHTSTRTSEGMTVAALETHRPGGKPSELQDEVGQPDGRIVEEIEHDADGDRRGDQRQQQQELDDALPDEGAVEDEGGGDAEYALDRDREGREGEGPAERVRESAARSAPARSS